MRVYPKKTLVFYRTTPKREIKVILSDLDHFRNDPMIRFKEEIVDGKSYTIVSYMIADKSYWDTPLADETRGITFETDTGKCVSRPFLKFFNVGERADTDQASVARDFVQCFEKRDGCLDENTLIETEDGIKTIKEICETNYHGLIMGYDENSGCFIQTQIEGLSIKESSNSIWYEIELENGVKLKLTDNHRVWSKLHQCYIQASDLTIGEDIIFKEI